MSKESYFFMLYNNQSDITGLIYQTRKFIKFTETPVADADVLKVDVSRYTPDELDLAIDVLTMEYPDGEVIIQITNEEATLLIKGQMNLTDIDPFTLKLCPYNRKDF